VCDDVENAGNRVPLVMHVAHVYNELLHLSVTINVVCMSYKLICRRYN
jgi:hypothetical protein